MMTYNSTINSLTNKLAKINSLQIAEHKMLAKYASFKIGGPADLFLTPENITAVRKILPLIAESKLPYFVLGKGSNLIISDLGYRGIIIYTGKLNNYQIKENSIIAETGLELKDIAEIAYQNSLTGLEFAGGIPGSLGGALYMNAGAYGGEMKDVIQSAELVDETGEAQNLKLQQLKLSYRNSLLQQQEKNWLAVKVTLQLKTGKKTAIKTKMEDLQQRRWSKQPLEFPSAGSIFKRPAGYYTGPLIEKAGLKGFQIGGAQVSKKHAGFIINTGSATAADVINLINKIKQEVYKISGVQLEIEPRLLGEF
jgi:UDP-N-acetylmuramate dehydrogenase